MTRIEDLMERRDDAQSQLDALAGECPEVAERLIADIQAYNRMIREG